MYFHFKCNIFIYFVTKAWPQCCNLFPYIHFHSNTTV
jgi:hypothetical protein